jgi:uncharacterized protein (DUF885 family)
LDYSSWGIYKDPLQHWGIARRRNAARHAARCRQRGCTPRDGARDQAIDYMLANSGMGRTDATSEVERYIAMAGTGAEPTRWVQLTIQRLRTKAEAGAGAEVRPARVPRAQVLDARARCRCEVLEAKIDRWIASQRGA